MSRVVRKTKTKEKNKVSSQYSVADPDPADLDVKQTRNKKYQAKPPQSGGLGKINIKEGKPLNPLYL